MEIRFNSARLLELQGLKSDRELARDLGISRSQLYRIRSGASFPGRRFLENLTDCYPQFPVSEASVYQVERRYPFLLITHL